MGEPGTAEMALLVACARGDREAWDTLRGRYHAALHAALRGAGARDELDDLEQEVWARLLGNDCAALREFRGGSFKAFLKRVAINTYLDHIRARSVRVPASSPETPSGVLCAKPSVESRLTDNQQRAQLSAALDAAAAESDNPARDRDILRLRFEEELSPAEIAALGIGLGPDGVEAVIRRAVDRVRDFFASES
jgi:RNA polymerase sigma factor (sigma-70 family)